MAQSLTQEQIEYRRWLLVVERRTMLPIKWVILLASVLLWQLSHDWDPLPKEEVFSTFFFYTLINIALTYFVPFSKLTLNQIKPLCYISYLIDLLFVSVLIWLDNKFYGVENLRSDFYVFYFLLIIRGFSLFERKTEGALFHLLIMSLFVGSTWFTSNSFNFLLDQAFLLKVFLLWIVILISWFIMELIRKQHSDLARTRENLARSESLAMVGEMAASVAHEINNPVGIIFAYAEFMLKQSEENDPRREDLQILADEANRCKKIVSELLNFSRSDAPVVSQAVDLRQLNDEVVRFVFHDRANHNITVNTDYGEAPPAQIDPIQIKQALVNIYLNAKQAMSDSGAIDVSLRRCGTVGGHVCLRIVNSGPPITKEELQRAFEPFYTSKKTGSGLGLSITRRIVEAHHGEITIDRNPDGPGTFVELLLPATKDFAETETEA